jgi:glutathione S-transferase
MGPLRKARRSPFAFGAPKRQHEAMTLALVGRSSSHFTRVPRVLAHELGLTLPLVAVHDITAVDAEVFAGNPALKLPTLRDGAQQLFGAENICRALAERAGAFERVVWPEQLRSALSRNAQELVWHAMAAQVQLVFGGVVSKLPSDNVYFAKARAGLTGALSWLEAHLGEALAALPEGRTVSLFEVTLFCLLEHLAFRGTVAVEQGSALAAFARDFARRPSAQATVYGFDPPPSP